MFEVLKAWFFKYFGDPEAAILLIALALGVVFIWCFGRILAPLLASIVVAYLLEGVITPLQKRLKFSRSWAITTVFVFFIALLVFAVIGLLPTFSRQLSQFVAQLPATFNQLQLFLNSLALRYPNFLSPKVLQNLINSANFNVNALTGIGNHLLANSLESISMVVTWVVYILLVPLLTFFILKDKKNLVSGVEEFMPEQRGLILEVWYEMKTLLGRYVRGKVLEVSLVTLATWIGFSVLQLNFAFLLAFLTGLSAILPYIGLVIVTIPVTVAALLQWGVSPHFFYLMLVYAVIQVLDGNVLVPLLFSEAMNLNPVIIITAVLFFGSIWGFWGLFFAIPLATLVKAVIQAWMRHANRTYSTNH